MWSFLTFEFPNVLAVVYQFRASESMKSTVSQVSLTWPSSPLIADSTIGEETGQDQKLRHNLFQLQFHCQFHIRSRHSQSVFTWPSFPLFLHILLCPCILWLPNWSFLLPHFLRIYQHSIDAERCFHIDRLHYMYESFPITGETATSNKLLLLGKIYLESYTYLETGTWFCGYSCILSWL